MGREEAALEQGGLGDGVTWGFVRSAGLHHHRLGSALRPLGHCVEVVSRPRPGAARGGGCRSGPGATGPLTSSDAQEQV